MRNKRNAIGSGLLAGVLAASACRSPTQPGTSVALARLSVTNFLAVGDSITAGEIPDCTDTVCASVTHVVQPALSYPTQLQAMLGQRYPAQTITMTNVGVQGQTAAAEAPLLDGQLTVVHPDVLLLLEGVNDLDENNPVGSMQSALNALQSMIQDAHQRGVRVVISTLLPEVMVTAPGDRANVANLIVPFNSQLVTMALGQGALVVDMYSDFLTDLPDWISPLDGLHPTAAGYVEMARVFSNEIQTAFGVPAVSAAPSSTR